MATLILTTIGTVIGGPIGGAIGGLIGKQIDNSVFGPGVRQGPRLSELKVQTSRYGNAIPKLFGAVRVAGTVIWSTDLIETRTRQSNGKGRGATDIYSYQASFAVALSARPIRRIGRIWADGQLLRGVAGDFKSETGFRFYKGDEGQPIDPMIASREGLAATPAYRGIAYAVFEDMQLADYGNRIPSLSFEVFADDADLPAGAIMAALGPIESDDGPIVSGMAVTETSLRAVAETFARSIALSVTDDVGLRMRFGPLPQRTMIGDDLGSGRERTEPRVKIDRRAASELPDVIALAYADKARDYQDGIQRARRDSSARRVQTIDFPATLSAERAREMAERRLSQLWTGRTRATVTLPWRALSITPGTLVSIPGQQGQWRVETAAFEAMTVRLSLERWSAPLIPAGLADAGRPLPQPDRVHGATLLRVIDLPSLRDEPTNQAALVVVANGSSGGWRRAGLLASLDGGTNYSPIGQTASPCTFGVTGSALAEAPHCALIEMTNSVEVQLVNSEETLSDADMAALLRGANTALIDEEVLQFARAKPLGNGRWRLCELWRGRRGTEWAAVTHATGAPFTLIEGDALKPLADEWIASGVTVMAIGVGDDMGVTAMAPDAIGVARLPLSPVGLKAEADGADRIIRWTRRSRDGWRWHDAVDAPIGEEREAYRLVKRAANRPDVTAELTETHWIYSNAERAIDATAGATTVTIEVSQIGTYGAGRATSLTLSTV